MRKSFILSLISVVGVLQLGACGGGASNGSKLGTAGGGSPTGGTAGSSGTAGAGAAGTGDQSGTAGDTGPGSGTAGDSGTAGATSGTAGAGTAGAGTTTGTAGVGTTTGTGGAGTAGAGATGGTAGGTGTGTSGHATGMSAGCGKENMDPAAKYVEHDIMVNVAPAYSPAYTMRKFFTYMPHNYDPNHAYPVTMWGSGCGASGPESNQLMGSGATDSYIEIQLLQLNSCFSTSSADSPEVPYFDEVLKQVSDNYCIDKGQVFVAGYSSGSWLTHLLGCQRGNVIRGIGSASGGILVDHGTCTGPIAAILTADSSDTTNPIISIDAKTGTPKGSGAARDRILMANGCQMTSKPWNPAFPGCEIYDGCPADYPVVWCLTMGQGHSTGGINSSKGFWTFWSALPKLQ
jgi:hypothetical protein